MPEKLSNIYGPVPAVLSLQYSNAPALPFAKASLFTMARGRHMVRSLSAP